jgi:TrmH family RNA methyltransferase
MGGIFHLHFLRATPHQLHGWSREHNVKLIALSPYAKRLWTDLPAAGPFALLLGEERHGLTPAADSLCDLSVRLPMTGRADSLNVGVAAGVMMYELIRRQPL